MQRVRFLMLGGFLGAGKTTAIARLARHYIDAGLSVGLVTNDQAYGLVDTQSLRAQGFDVGEVTGACFCCKFDDLVATARQLAEHRRPDVIIAEPVGSCTDLMATVVAPLRKLYGDAYEVGPLAVLLKPEHGLKILGDEPDLGFSPKAAYIFLKQLEEADVVVVNKVDRLTEAERQRLVGLMQRRFPDKEVLAVSARSGQDFEQLTAAMDRPAPRQGTTPDVDYDIYAEGEAELGWLNCTIDLAAARIESAPWTVDDVLLGFVRRLAKACQAAGAEPAHLKVLATADGATAIANLVSSNTAAELSVASHTRAPRIELTVNARVAIDPESLTAIVEREARQTAAALAGSATVRAMQSFRPGRPVPTHRLTTGHAH